MPPLHYANNPSTTLSGAITAGATSLSVTSAADFPAHGRFTIIVDSEIMLVTGVSGTIFTVERGYDGTSAAAHNNNATVTAILTKRSFLDAHHFDIRAYGAVGDGSTDDAAAAQAAITAAQNAGGGKVYFPAGSWKIGSPLQVSTRNVELIGAGKQVTVLTSGEGVAAIQTVASVGTPLRGIVIRDMTIKNGSALSASHFLLQIDDVGEDVLLSNLLIHGNNVPCGGLRLKDSWMATIEDVHFEQLSSNAFPAVELVSNGSTSSGLGHPMNTIRFLNCTWQHCNEGVDIHNPGVASPGAMHAILFLNPRFKRMDMVGSYGIRARNSNLYNVNIIGGFFEDIERPIVVEGSNWHIDGAYIEHCLTGISVESGRGHVIENITFNGPVGNEIGTGVHVKSTVTGPVHFRNHRTSGTPTTRLFTDDSLNMAEPWALVPLYGAAVAGFAHIGAAGRTVYIPCTLDRVGEITGIEIVVGTSSGNISAALYDSTGTRILTTGSIPCPVTGRGNVNFTGNSTLSAGNYYLALSADNTTATFAQGVAGATSVGLARFEAVHPAPATATFAGTTNAMPTIYGRFRTSPF